MSAPLQVIYHGDLRTTCEHVASGKTFETHSSTDHAAKLDSFSPIDVCATSLAACAATVMGLYAQNHGLDVSGTRVEIEKTMLTNPMRFGKIICTFHMPDRDYSEKDKTLLERAARACPVHASLSAECEKEFVFLWAK